MHCDRAQEFFSDYLERTLDRPMTVALEAHLAGCAICREEIEGLQSTFTSLDAVPAVEPPADGAWQVMRRLRNERAERVEAERRQAPTFLDWLRSLNPLSVGMGASLATLVIGGTLMLTNGPWGDYVKHDLGGFGGSRPATPVKPVDDAPAIQVSYGQFTAAGQLVNIQVAPAIDLPDAQIKLVGASIPLNWNANGRLARGQWVSLPPIDMPRTPDAQAVRVLVDAPAVGKHYRYLAVVYLGARKGEKASVFFSGVPLEEGLRRLAPFVGAPIVVNGQLDGSVTLRVDEQSPMSCLRELAGQVGGVVEVRGGVYHLSAEKK
jgi:hypothetical protein